MKKFLTHGAKINLKPNPDWDWVRWDGNLTISAQNNPLQIHSDQTILSIHVSSFAADYSPQAYKSKVFCDVAGGINSVNFVADEHTLSSLIRINGSPALLSTTTGTFTAVVSAPSQKTIPTGTIPDTLLIKTGTWKVIDPNQQMFHESKSAVNTNHQISAETYNKIAENIGAEPAVIRALTDVESLGSGFDKNGRVKVRFEGHKFKQCLENKGIDVKKLVRNGHGDVIHDYSAHKEHGHDSAAYDKAAAIDDQCAKSSSSFGAFQIMGFNYKQAGFNSLDEFVDAQNTPDGQAKSFANFISHDPAKVKALQKKDFSTFSKLYNGPDYKEHNYDGKIQDAYDKHSQPPESKILP